MHKLAVKDWYTEGHTNWDISQEFSNSLFLPEAWSLKASRPVSVPSPSQPPATAGAASPMVAAVIESPVRQNSPSGPVLTSCPQAAVLARPQPLSIQQPALIHSGALLAGPMASPPPGAPLVRPIATMAPGIPPRPPTSEYLSLQHKSGQY